MRAPCAIAWTLVCAAGAAVCAAQGVVINEIHYNPSTSTDYEEFLELFNPGAASVSLMGWTISDGVVFAFPDDATIPAGGFLVIAKYPDYLEAATGYSGALQWTSGSLENGGGERIAISDADSVVVDEVTYADYAPWPTAPDGGGPSLELINPALDNTLPSAWGASLAAYGTPGLENSVFTSAPVIVDEIPARMTAVESLTAVTVVFSTDVTGVDPGDLLVAGSPATAVAPPSGPASTYTFTGFPTPAAGSVAITVSPGGIQGGLPFGGDAWTISVGQVIVINEIHYHPPDPNGDAEFIELYNAGTSDVALEGWKFNAGVQLTFESVILPANGYLVVALNPTLLEQVTGFPGAIPWTSGRLDNGGEGLAVVDNHNNLVDALQYVDRGSWPQAPDGDGPSLELVNPRLPNEYGPSWKASNGNWGTPGAQNSIYQASVAPIIVNTRHEPAIPAPSQNVTISALVLDDQPDPTVTLYYRQDQVPTITYSSTPMLDDGLHGDGAAGDDVYGATVTGVADGQRLDFTIRASDGTNTGAAPPGHNTLDAGQNPAQTYLCPFSAQPPATDFPAYHLITTQYVRNQQDNHVETEFDATFIRRQTNGTYEIYYNVIEHYRGASSLGQHPHSFHIKFSQDQPLESEMGFTITRLLLNSQSIVRQYLGNRFFRDAFGGALPAPYTQFVRLHTSPLSHGGSQNYIYINVERIDDDFLQSQGNDLPPPPRYPDRCTGSEEVCAADADCPPGETCAPTDDGNLYRGRYNDSHLRWEGYNPTAYMVDGSGQNGYELENNEDNHDWTDLITLCWTLDASTNPDTSVGQEAYEQSVSRVADALEWVRWFGVHMLLVNWEGGIYRDTGDDYYLYFAPPSNPAVFPLPDPLAHYHAIMLPWDMDSVFGGWANVFTHDSIWRTTVPSPQRLIRSNAFAGRFVDAIGDMLDNEFTSAHLDPIIDAIPDSIFTQEQVVLGYGSGYTKQAFKNWVVGRITFVNTEMKRNLTLNGVPASPYTNSNPVISLSGLVDQRGTRWVKVNGEVADNFSVYSASWSKQFTLHRGWNQIVVQCLDRDGQEVKRAEASVQYDPPPASIRLTVPKRMVNTKTLTLKAELLDANGNIDWRIWNHLGTVSATRVANGQVVPTSVNVFETYGAGAGQTTPADSIRCYNGIGSVSIVLDNGAAEPAGDIQVTVTVEGVSSSQVVTVLADEPGLFKNLAGALIGADLTWGPGDGVIHLTGHVAVPSGQTLTILPGTLIMVDAGTTGDGTKIHVASAALQAQGTQADPILFFPTAGLAGMTLPQTVQINPNSWGGLNLIGSGASTLSYVFLTGAGNNPTGGHPRPVVMRLENTHALTATDCVFADAPGKIVYGNGTGTYLFQRCLFSRNGIGGEFLNGGYNATFEDTWFTRIGRAQEAYDVDGDVLHIDYAGQSHLRRCVLTDGGDDMVDHSNGATPVFENCIIYDGDDKVVSIGGGGTVTMTNCLLFNVPNGVNCVGSAPVYLTHCTFGPGTGVNDPVCASSQIQECIFWPGSRNTCCGDVDYTLVGNPADLGCGTGNLSSNPLFFDSTFSPPGDLFVDFNLQQGSPGLVAGPAGGRIGWLGFPTAESCISDSDCEDGEICTDDSCDAGVCAHTAVPGCCHADSDCGDGVYCNGVETCGGDNFCDAGTPVNCGSQHCDESLDDCVDCLNNGHCNDADACTTDTCLSGTCSYAAVNCDDGDVCTNDACNSATGCVHTPNDGASCDDGNLCTEDDTCAGGTCVGTAVYCPPGQTCDPADGQCKAGPQTVTFQQGDVNGYGSTFDTYIDSALGSQAATTPIVVDGSPVEHILIRFDDIFGTEPNQIPPGSTIVSATLTLWVGPNANDQSNDAIHFHRLLHAWNDADVWAAYGISPPWNTEGGIQADNVDAVSTIDATATMSVIGQSYPVDVTTSLQFWAADPSSSFGWAILPTGNDGLRLVSAEGAAANRPLLTVSYTSPVTNCTSDDDCDDGLYCNGVEHCNLSTFVCEPGTPPDCSDGVACTTDSCDESTDACVHTPNDAACSDGQFCNGAETCNAVTGCQPGTPPTCDDGTACTADACNETTDQCDYIPNNALCDDGVFCNGAETCVSGTGCVTGTNPCQPDEVCEEAVDVCLGAPSVVSNMSRYLAVTPPPGLPAVALQVSSPSVLLPCLPRYVDAAGRLVDNPVFRSSIEWGTVYVGDREVIPGDTVYEVRAGVGDPLVLSVPADTTTGRWADVTGDEEVTILDILCVLDGFQSIFGQCTLYSDDLAGNVPDGIIDLLDITAVLDGFSGLPYPDTTPCATKGRGGRESDSGETVIVTLVPRRAAVGPGELVAVDVFVSNVTDLRGYQLASEVTPQPPGLTLESLAIDAARADYVFSGAESFPVVDAQGQRLASAAFSGVPAEESYYVATFVFRAVPGVSGPYRVSLWPEKSMVVNTSGGFHGIYQVPAVITTGVVLQQPPAVDRKPRFQE